MGGFKVPRHDRTTEKIKVGIKFPSGRQAPVSVSNFLLLLILFCKFIVTCQHIFIALSCRWIFGKQIASVP